MPLQTSGAISLANIQSEFGGSNPISISEYYGADTGIPSSGAIDFADFYGKSSGPPLLVQRTVVAGNLVNKFGDNKGWMRPTSNGFVGTGSINNESVGWRSGIFATIVDSAIFGGFSISILDPTLTPQNAFTTVEVNGVSLSSASAAYNPEGFDSATNYPQPSWSWPETFLMPTTGASYVVSFY